MQITEGMYGTLKGKLCTTKSWAPSCGTMCHSNDVVSDWRHDIPYGIQGTKSMRMSVAHNGGDHSGDARRCEIWNF